MLKIPYINPVRFFSNKIIDNDNVMPFADNERVGVNYQKGIVNINYSSDFIVGKKISIFFAITGGYYKLFAYVWKASIRTVIPIIDITPSNWVVGEKLFLFEHVFNSFDEYFFEIYIKPNPQTSKYYYSNKINVTDGQEKNLVKIQYYDSQNRYGGYFSKEILHPHYPPTYEWVWQPVMYYTGNIRVITPEDEQFTYKDQQGDTTILQSTPQRVQLLTLTDINANHIDIIKQQSVCDYFFVNDVRFAASNMTIATIEDSDLVNITFKLIQKDNEYLFLY